MLWYDVLCLIFACIALLVAIAFLVYCAFIVYYGVIKDYNKSSHIIGVAYYKKCSICFTSCTYKRGSYRLTTLDGVYLLPINYTQIHFYKENNNEKQN